MPEMLEILGLLLVFGVILLLCYYTTRFIGKKMSGRTKNKYIRIVDTLPLGMDKNLYLILVGKKHFLLFSDKKGLELVSEIDMEGQIENSAEEYEHSAGVSVFKRIFETYSGLSNRPNKEQDSGQGKEEKELNEAGVVGSIKRLKRMNSNNR